MTPMKEDVRGLFNRPDGVVTIGEGETVTAAARKMRAKRIGCLIVTDGRGKLVGIVTERDMVHHIICECADPSRTLTRDVMVPDVVFCPAGAPLDKALEAMARHNIRHLPIVEGDMAVGMISSREVMARQAARDQETRDLTIFALAKLAESRDTDTGTHLERVRLYARILAEDLAAHGKFPDEIDANFIRLIYATCPLHDIGKVAIPDHILLKPGRLDEREFGIMEAHASEGACTLDLALKQYPDADYLLMARDIAASHHERVDGTGYPAGLAGDDIPLAARVFAPVDVYDALVSKRVYKDAYTHEVARNILVEGEGTQFDAEVIQAFLRCEDQFVKIKEGQALEPAAA